MSLYDLALTLSERDEECYLDSDPFAESDARDDEDEAEELDDAYWKDLLTEEDDETRTTTEETGAESPVR